jgi:small-conductance mechanosensitive channel
MMELLPGLAEVFTPDRALAWLRALILLGLGLAVAKIISSIVVRMVKRKLEEQQTALIRRGLYYLLVVLFGVAALNQLGFNLGVLIGAAGILTVAIGFASQTSASNVISGLFLIAERPFSVGDVIQVGDKTGQVLSIDLLSAKLRTFDNLFVRIPNETLVKSEITTLTRFPIRRADLQIGVAYKEDLSKVRSVLLKVAEQNPLALTEPQPLFMILGFGSSAIDLQFSVWTQRQNFLVLKTGILEEIKHAFEAEGIEIPFPHLSLYTGSATEPFPVSLNTDRTVGP